MQKAKEIEHYRYVRIILYLIFVLLLSLQTSRIVLQLDRTFFIVEIIIFFIRPGSPNKIITIVIKILLLGLQ